MPLFPVETAALLFITFWAICVNAAFFVNTHTYIKITLWALGVAVAIITSYGLDAYYQTAPHFAWQTTSLYATFGLVSLLFSVPGFLWQQSKKTQKQKRN